MALTQSRGGKKIKKGASFALDDAFMVKQLSHGEG